MGFRGVLLQLTEGDDSAFRMISPDAEMMLPTNNTLRRDSLARVTQQKLVVTDFVSAKLLQISLFAIVSIRQETNSALWIGSVADDRSIGCNEARDALLRNKTDESTPTASSTGVVINPVVLQQRQTKRVCYCFHFRSEYEFDLFKTTVAAYRRLQQYSLLERSVEMEIDIHNTKELEITKTTVKKSKPQMSPPHASNNADSYSMDVEKLLPKAVGQHRQVLLCDELQTIASARTQQVDDPTRVSKLIRKMSKKQTDEANDDMKPTRLSMSLTPSEIVKSNEIRCILCRASQNCSANPFPKHPFVLKDGRGEAVHICKVCMQQALQRRINTGNLTGHDVVCNLCCKPTGEMLKQDTKQCAHAQCHRVYCLQCVQKLIGSVQKILRAKHWLCPNCTTFDTNQKESYERESPQGSANGHRSKKKRKIHNEILNEVIDSSNILQSSSKMTPVDYAATYFQFLTQREASPPEEESEDACFCCKDGGELIECDWTGLNNKFARCPKVYHADCLGYDVPEDKVWNCPRHRCMKCGIIAQYSCRFCVTSYCTTCVPKEIKKLGAGTRDIPNSVYVLCTNCERLSLKGVEQGKLPPEVYAQIFHPIQKLLKKKPT